MPHWEPSEQQISDKLIEMAYVWGDIEEELARWASADRKQFESDDYRAHALTMLSAPVSKAFRVEAAYQENGFGDPCSVYVLLFDVTDSEARELATPLTTNSWEREALQVLINERAHPWHTRDNLDVRLTRASVPVEGEICRRFGEEHPPSVTPTLEDVPVPAPLGDTTGLERRGPYLLTPIEAPIYDRLAETGLTFSVQPFLQHADLRIRPDFLVFYDGGVVAIELDGHDYHKTKEQRGRDAEKQNFLAGRKIVQLRFTGSQVFRDPDGCVQQIVDAVRTAPARP